MTPEKEVQNQILNYLEELKDSGAPIFYERRQSGGVNYKKGIPDIYIVINGIHIEVECKRVNGKLSVMQEKFREMCDKCNIIYYITDSFLFFKSFIDRLL